MVCGGSWDGWEANQFNHLRLWVHLPQHSSALHWTHRYVPQGHTNTHTHTNTHAHTHVAEVFSCILTYCSWTFHLFVFQNIWLPCSTPRHRSCGGTLRTTITQLHLTMRNKTTVRLPHTFGHTDWRVNYFSVDMNWWQPCKKIKTTNWQILRTVQSFLEVCVLWVQDWTMKWTRTSLLMCETWKNLWNLLKRLKHLTFQLVQSWPVPPLVLPEMAHLVSSGDGLVVTVDRESGRERCVVFTMWTFYYLYMCSFIVISTP